MKQNDRHYARLEVAIPGFNSIVHCAEMATLTPGESCRIVKMVEMADGSNVTGGFRPGVAEAMMAEPNEVVPHPNRYDEFPDIDYTPLTAEEFEALWQKACALHPGLKES